MIYKKQELAALIQQVQLADITGTYHGSAAQKLVSDEAAVGVAAVSKVLALLAAHSPDSAADLLDELSAKDLLAAFAGATIVEATLPHIRKAAARRSTTSLREGLEALQAEGEARKRKWGV